DEIAKALDNTPSLKRYLGEEGKRSKLLDMAEKLVKDAVREGRNYDEDLLKSTAEEVNGFVSEFGVTGGEDDIYGLGIAPAVGQSEAHAQKPPKPTGLFDADAQSGLLEELAYYVRGGEA